MKLELKGHTAIIKETKGTFFQFIENVCQQYNYYKEQNLILDLSNFENLTIIDLKEAKNLSKKRKKEKKSLVFVIENINYNEIPEYLLVVPSVLEAHDIIEMEEIERDLGF